ncbi:MAG: YlbF family regulator [Clostridiales bacterium]|nr:YlbF family regulator [Clostridiales bacterium]
MYVYDEANNLAKAIKESKEYLEYKKIKQEVNSNPEMKSKIEEFEKLRYEVQLATFQGETQNIEKTKKLEEMYQILLQDAKIKEFFDIEVRFNIMLADVNKIIGESVQDLLQ